MKNILIFIVSFIFLTGCVQNVAFLGPAFSIVKTGGVQQALVSESINYGVKKQTGKSPMEHALAYAEKHNPEKKKTNCVAFLKSTESEICEAVKKNIIETKEYFKNKNKIVIRSKIEDLARKSVIYNRR